MNKKEFKLDFIPTKYFTSNESYKIYIANLTGLYPS